MFRQIVILTLACLGLQQAGAQSKLSVYARKLIARQGTAAPTRATAPDLVPAYIYLEAGTDPAALSRLGVEVNTRAGSVVTARIPAGSLEAVAALGCVKYVQTGVPVMQMMDTVRPATGADKVNAGTDLPAAYTGKGVVVGIIDSGFDYTHPDFYDTDRGTLRIKRVWEQGYSGGTPPEGFTYGGELTTTEAILTAAGDVTTNSHGTHVAGIAAGADTESGYYGIAPGADIVLVSMAGAGTANNVNLSDAIAYIYRYAEEEGKPCVINMSLGNQSGPHDGTSTFDLLADGMQGAGRLIVGSAGNFGANRLHAAKTFDGGRADTLRTFIDYTNRLSTTTAGGDIEIWGEPGMALTVNVLTYNTSRNTVGERMTVATDGSQPGEAEAELSGSAGLMSAFAEVSPLNDKPHVLVSSGVTGLRSGYVVGIEIISETAGRTDVWADATNVTLTDNGLDGWTGGDTEMTVAEIGGTGREIISVGAYATRDGFDTENMGHVSTGETVGDIGSFSATGPTADGRMKPDISAPGCYTVSAISSNDAAIASYPIACYYEWNGANRYYAYMQGTSMAAPAVTGIIATWLEANPALTPADVRSILAATATTDTFTGDIAGTGNSTWGYGKIDAWAGIKEAIALASGITGVTDGSDGGITFATDGRRLLVTGLNGGTATLDVYNTAGTLVRQTTVNTTETDLGTLPQGLYIVKLTGTAGTASGKIMLR